MRKPKLNYSAHTLRGYRKDVAEWTAWCADNGMASFPATFAVLGRYIRAMAPVKAKGTVRRSLHAIKWWHGEQDVPLDIYDDRVELIVESIKFKSGTGRRMPLFRDDFERMAAACGSNLRDRQNKALLALNHQGALSRVAIETLMWHQIKITDEYVSVFLSGTPSPLFLLSDPNQDLCPVVTLRKWQQGLRGMGVDGGRVFRHIHKSGKIQAKLTGQVPLNWLKDIARQAGINPDRVTLTGAKNARIHTSMCFGQAMKRARFLEGN